MLNMENDHSMLATEDIFPKIILLLIVGGIKFFFSFTNVTSAVS